ncbi:single-stranded DNA-binding protein [Nakamurella alba]|uniref:single-stranded DNA-binding protein n=1 Tax=Nakamurella alba TaxID=2665158 RepID=UPI0018AAEFED|nr:single-stranded DNA-binding protein [Nakamurella alba]
MTIVGRVASNPTIGLAANGNDRSTMRVVSTERRFDEANGEWVDGDEFGVNVVSWRRTATGVIEHLRKGDPIVVIGRISTRRYERENGATDWFTDVKADVVALDVARVNGKFKRTPAPEGPAGAVAPVAEDADADAEGAVAGVDSEDQVDVDEAVMDELTERARPLVPGR